MAKEVVVLTVRQDVAGLYNVTCVFWLAVPSGSEFPQPTFTSRWLGASPAENSLLQAGNVVEEVYTFWFPNTYTKAQIETELSNAYSARQGGYAGQPKTGQFYGLYLDSATGWSN